MGADCPAAALAFVSGCSETSVAQNIVNWTPGLESAVATVDSTAALLAPADAPVFAAATAGFDGRLEPSGRPRPGVPSQSFGIPCWPNLQAAVRGFQQQ